MESYSLVCLRSGAIHLKTAASLYTDSFINALRPARLSRRGPVRQLRSDNEWKEFRGSSSRAVSKKIKKTWVRAVLRKCSSSHRATGSSSR